MPASCRRESRSSTRGGDECGVCQEGQQAARVTVTTSTGLARRVTPVGVVLRRRRGMETGIRLVCEGRHSRGSPVPFGVCALPWSREKRFARFQRETRGGNVGRQRTWKILFAEGHRIPGKGETENTAGRPTGAAWRTSRRPTLPLSPTPFPISPFASLLLNGRKKRSRSFYVFYRCRIASYFSFFHFRHRQIRAWRCTFFV